MAWFRLVWINLWRRRLRSLVTASGVGIAIATFFCVIAFQQGYQNGLRTELDQLGAHLIVVPKGCPYDAASIALHGASWPCYLKSQYLNGVRQTAHVAVAAPVLMTALYDEKTGGQNVYCGIDSNMPRLKRMWRLQAGSTFALAAGDLLVGAEFARAHRWKVGQRVLLPGVPSADGTVRGILQPTDGPDDLFVYLPLADAQRLFHRPDQLTHVLVRLDDPDTLDTVVRELRSCDAGLDMTVVPLGHLFETIQGLVHSTRLLLVSVTLVALLVAGAGVSNTILTAVTERTREIGVLRALGASRGRVFGLIWAETALLCAFGGGVGIAVAAAAATGIERALRARLPYAPSDPLVRFDWRLALLCLAASLLLGTLASALPAFRASRLSPAEAMA